MTDHFDLIRRLVIPMVRERSREPGDAWHQAEQALSSQSLSLSEAREALRECQAALAMMVSPERISATTLASAYATATAAEAKARSVLENSKAVLADAHTNPASSDLSSLRKGAEDARSQAEMLLLAIMAGDPASELKLRVNDIIAALVSGSREDRASLLRTIETLPDDFTDDGNCCAGKLKEPRP